MKHKELLLLSTLCLPPLLALTAPEDTIDFRPEEGSTLTKKFQTEAELALDNMALKVNGSPPPVDLSGVEMSVSEKKTVTVTDKYVSLGKGRPAKLERSFDEISSDSQFEVDMAMMGQPQEGPKDISMASDLEGKTVVFVWDEEASEYTVNFEGDEGDSDLLEGLWQDMDLCSLLPEEPVAEGDTWEIALEGLKNLLAPGGKLHLTPEGDSEMDMMGMGSGPHDAADMLGNFDGTATGEYAGVREVDGVRCAEIKLDIDVSTANDLTEIVKETMANMDMPEVPPMDFDHMDIELEFDLEGTLLWDLQSGVFHSLELSGVQNMTMDMAMNMTMMEQSMEISQAFDMSGSFRMNVTTE